MVMLYGKPSIQTCALSFYSRICLGHGKVADRFISTISTMACYSTSFLSFLFLGGGAG